MALAIRRATVADAPTLSRIATQTFTETFGHLYPEADLQAFIADSYSVEKQAVILGHPDYAVWLLEDDGVAVGHAAAGPCGLPHPDVAAGDGELKRLYVLPSVQNGGWGGRLFQAALDWLQSDGPRTLWIGVWSQNLGAQRLYGRHGFAHVGDYEFIVGNTRDHEYILRRGPTMEPST
ncbi:GNAT family N-acetyltransferase [Montanilutibacter psychrotolerans]|uniref:GNAT family N-acetyltransferase n=1 Tax=Montanilutibacter psychrotolerans TaxID=1327343 RepID=A0A3M8SSC0_9GAMM|nr:GNAT family N-acetyltransferase [Lysobacter psychrotolerans]RNF84228.1 GNAT family N-acetyltransferase [Lysobacter psychrotolerans]